MRPGLWGIVGLVIFNVHSLEMCLLSQFVIDLSQESTKFTVYIVCVYCIFIQTVCNSKHSPTLFFLREKVSASERVFRH